MTTTGDSEGMSETKWTPLERELYEALERMVEQTYQAAIARGEESMAVRMARIHATAALAKARGCAAEVREGGEVSK